MSKQAVWAPLETKKLKKSKKNKWIFK
jgi:hypothetical protein